MLRTTDRSNNQLVPMKPRGNVQKKQPYSVTN